MRIPYPYPDPGTLRGHKGEAVLRKGGMLFSDFADHVGSRAMARKVFRSLKMMKGQGEIYTAGEIKKALTHFHFLTGSHYSAGKKLPGPRPLDTGKARASRLRSQRKRKEAQREKSSGNLGPRRSAEAEIQVAKKGSPSKPKKRKAPKAQALSRS